ncbi:MAG: hypothetical protein B6244_04660 [Candidatus Cloacimonetes bacterium 4572_55]|nr:MAG: hypothetical protein B6244_04660 [Candidatus Cloacimonetes bacterium 4572_55]
MINHQTIHDIQCTPLIDDQTRLIEVTVKVPKYIKNAVDDMEESLYVEALHEVAARRFDHIQHRVNRIKEKIKVYEMRYKQSFDQFASNVPDSLPGHEDWIDWSYLNKLQSQLTTTCDKLRLVAGQ